MSVLSIVTVKLTLVGRLCFLTHLHNLVVDPQAGRIGVTPESQQTARRAILFALQDRGGKKPGQSEVSKSRRVVSVTSSLADLRVPIAHPMTVINLVRVMSSLRSETRSRTADRMDRH